MTTSRFMLAALLCVLLVACDKGGAKKPVPPPAPAGGAANNLEAAPLIAVKTGPAKIQMAELAKAVRIYTLAHNDQPPATLEDACGAAPKDPWGTPYFYRVENGKPIIWSAGPDKTTGTQDDVFP